MCKLLQLCGKSLLATAIDFPGRVRQSHAGATVGVGPCSRRSHAAQHSAQRYYANSSSILFAARSKLAIRKLRICPARTASGLDFVLVTLPFQRA